MSLLVYNASDNAIKVVWDSVTNDDMKFVFQPNSNYINPGENSKHTLYGEFFTEGNHSHKFK